ncbi:hypothetical protein [Paenibacillus sp. W2I17]|uniref:hypothetical protein n=1 Tax=Paenibacillus sp. W2I17 TaxID=3042311 RepID=UPI00278698AF|nr:hypothetical protein [Paenibacillus sp. W2I17]MDQ0659215.1 hypothetical protein [Paenibacillus sp. W2I17]
MIHFKTLVQLSDKNIELNDLNQDTYNNYFSKAKLDYYNICILLNEKIVAEKSGFEIWNSYTNAASKYINSKKVSVPFGVEPMVLNFTELEPGVIEVCLQYEEILGGESIFLFNCEEKSFIFGLTESAINFSRTMESLEDNYDSHLIESNCAYIESNYNLFN